MLTLFSYPELFGVADNNPFGLKVFAFLKLCQLAFRHEHIFDAKQAPRGQLPYLLDGEDRLGDSDVIIAHLTARYGLTIDDCLTPKQRDTGLLLRRMLDDLYWIMSYSRWKDPSFWPLFRDAIISAHPSVTVGALDAAREYNFQRYHYHGVGRYEPAAVYERGVASLQVLANLLPAEGFLFGPQPTSIDAAIYGFMANIYFYDIDTPLKHFVASKQNVVMHCNAVHARLQSHASAS